MALNLFLSHAWADKDIDQMKQLEYELHNDGHHIWVDTNQISLGDDLFSKIEKGIKSCNVFIVMWSDEAASSKTVMNEIQLAENLGKPIFYVLIKEPISERGIEFMQKYFMLNYTKAEALMYILPVLRGHLMKFELNLMLIQQPNDSFEINNLISENAATLSLMQELYNHYVRRLKNPGERQGFAGFIKMQVNYLNDIIESSNNKDAYWIQGMKSFTTELINIANRFPNIEQNSDAIAAFKEAIQKADPESKIGEFDNFRNI